MRKYARANRNGSQMFRDLDGVLSGAKHRNDVLTFVMNWKKDLEPGEFISSVTNTANGVTLTNAENSRDTTSVDVTGIGWHEIKVVTTFSRTLIEPVRWYEKNQGIRLRDYRGGG